MPSQKKQDTALLDAVARVEYKKPLSQAGNQEEERSIIEEAMLVLLAQHRLEESICAWACLPGWC